MRKRTIRALLKGSYPVTLLLFGFVTADFLLWDSRGMVVLLSLMGLLFLAVLLLFATEERAKYLRIPVADEPEPPTTVIYGRDPHG